MNTDYHLHTTVSDGALTPGKLVEVLVGHGVREASITDHDALGAYPEALEAAPRGTIRIIPGIEMDAGLDNIEVHMLGIGLDLGPSRLREHVARTQAQRRQAVSAAVARINALLGEDTLDPAQVLAPGRETVMKPHLIRPLLAKGHFPGPDPESRYRAAQRWIKENVSGGALVDRPTAAEAIALIHGAHGRAFLAHPGYYVAGNGLDLEATLARLKDAGLDGVEATYAYFKPNSPEFPDRAAQDAMIARIERTAASLGLAVSGGSDGHDADGIAYFHAMYAGS